MTFDITFFGYGGGLVMAGWICGMIGSVLFGVFRRGVGI